MTRSRYSALIGLALLLHATGMSGTFAQGRAQRDSVGAMRCGGREGRPLEEWVGSVADLLRNLRDEDSASVSPPEQVIRPPLRYPPQPLAEGFEATVFVQGVVEVDGRVRYADVVDARVT